MIDFRKRAARVATVLALALTSATWAVDTTTLPNEQLQSRYEGLTHELRCMQCQNNSIADSPAGLASDLVGSLQHRLAQPVGRRVDALCASLVVGVDGTRDSWCGAASVDRHGIGRGTDDDVPGVYARANPERIAEHRCLSRAAECHHGRDVRAARSFIRD